MATRFGGARPAYSYDLKLRYVAGALGAVVVGLIVLLVFVLKDKTAQPPPAAAVQPDAFANTVAAPVPRLNILVARERIEDNMQISRDMIVSKPWDPDQLPEGALTARELDSIVGKWAKGLINANLPILRDQVSEQPPTSALNIPPGFRAVTITIDARSGVEGFAKPNSRVDVLFAFTDRDNKRKVTTLVRFVKILSVGGNVAAEGGRVGIAGEVTVTLLVTERDAKRIELARSLGSLSLTLVGGTGDGEQMRGDEAPVDINTLIGGQVEAKVAEEPVEGSMDMVDPKTGKMKRYVLRRGKWQPDEP